MNANIGVLLPIARGKENDMNGTSGTWMVCYLVAAVLVSRAHAGDPWPTVRSNQTSPDAKLFVFDVSQEKIVREIVPVSKGRTTGLIVEVSQVGYWAW